MSGFNSLLLQTGRIRWSTSRLDPICEITEAQAHELAKMLIVDPLVEHRRDRNRAKRTRREARKYWTRKP